MPDYNVKICGSVQVLSSAGLSDVVNGDSSAGGLPWDSVSLATVVFEISLVKEVVSVFNTNHLK